MPVALTDHVDRNREQNLLRGRVGKIHAWVLHPDESSDWAEGGRILQHLPLAIFVQFGHATWAPPGLSTPGLYPIVPTSAD
eukprot:4033639-Lingulodinium_polyedra.AAC.1